jgi:hypothetical protein
MPSQTAAIGSQRVRAEGGRGSDMGSMVASRRPGRRVVAGNGGLAAASGIAKPPRAFDNPGMNTPHHRPLVSALLLSLLGVCCAADSASAPAAAASPGPSGNQESAAAPRSADSAPGVARFDAQGRLLPPAGYREWVYLSTGFDMSYNPALRADHHMFDNVFVDPASYRSFLRTGTWPDKTMLVLEARGAQGVGSINKAGQYQSGDLMGLEVHVRDDARFPGGWAFFGVDGEAAAIQIPRSAQCYACHAKSGAVNSTFVQFYPTLLPVAEAKGTLSPTYLQMRAQLTAH